MKVVKRSLMTIVAASVLSSTATAVAVTEQSPGPRARTHVAHSFVRPFEYVLPPGWQPSLVREEVPLLVLAEADPGATWPELQRDGLKGLLVADVTAGFVHPCPFGDRVQVGGGAGTFLTDMQAVAGLDFEDLTMIELDGEPAVAASSLRPGRCGTGDIHIVGLPGFEDHIFLDVPSRLTVVDVDGHTVLVQAWAGSESDLDEWLPLANEFIASIHFIDEDP